MRLLVDRVRFNATPVSQNHFKDNFRVVGNQKSSEKLRNMKNTYLIPRSIWKALLSKPQTFSPEMTPLHLSMGRAADDLDHKWNKPSPGPSGNIELLKVPTFFHLTKETVKEQCDDLKKLLDDWPKNLPEREMKVRFWTSLYAGPDFKHPGPQKVIVSFPLSSIKLQTQEMRKLKLLLGHRYDPVTGVVKIVGDKFIGRDQNIDYAVYAMLKAIRESKVVNRFEVMCQKHNDVDNIPVDDLLEFCEPRKWRRRNCAAVVNGKYLRFNRTGHPFVYKIRKLGLVGPYSDRNVKVGPVLLDQDGKTVKAPTHHIVKARIRVNK